MRCAVWNKRQPAGKDRRRKAGISLPLLQGIVGDEANVTRNEAMKKPGQMFGQNRGLSAEETPGAGEGQTRTRKPVFSLPSGSKPLDGYTIKRGVGVGGFGEVYYGQTDGGKEVALKRIQRNLDIELRGVRQCLNLKHPNLLDLYDIKVDDQEQGWVVMEYVSGETLQQVIERNPNGMPLAAVDDWFDGITAGVAHLHKSGVVHRDLKPGNIFVDDNTVKVGDYGLCKFISCSRRSGQTQSVGTLHYMAPEIGQGRYGKEIDVYALGIMLYEMITGHVPFDGESSQEIIMKHLTAQPNLERVPQPYRTVVARALAKDPEKRLRDVDEMRAVLRQYRDGEVGNEAYIERVAPAAMLASAAANEPARAAAAPATPMNEEPIAKAVKAAYGEIADGLQSSGMGSNLRLALMAGAVLLLIINARWIIPYLGVLAMSYAIYLGIRAMLINKEMSRKSRRATKASAKKVNVQVAVRKRPRRMSRKMIERLKMEQLRRTLGEKTGRQRATETLGSMLMAALVAGVVSILGAVLVNVEGQVGFYEWGPNYLWLALTSMLAAWGVLVVSKGWESSTGDGALRRFWMLAMGVGVGAASYGLASWLRVEPIALLTDIQAIEARDMPPALHNRNGLPTIFGYMVYFAALFAILRWWGASDPARRARFSIFGTAIALFGGIIVQAFCPLPQGFLIAMTTCVAVQFAAPWISRDEREQARLLALARTAETSAGQRV